MYYLILKTKYGTPWGDDLCLTFKYEEDAIKASNEAAYYGGWRYNRIRKTRPSY